MRLGQAIAPDFFKPTDHNILNTVKIEHETSGKLSSISQIHSLELNFLQLCTWKAFAEEHPAPVNSLHKSSMAGNPINSRISCEVDPLDFMLQSSWRRAAHRIVKNFAFRGHGFNVTILLSRVCLSTPPPGLFAHVSPLPWAGSKHQANSCERVKGRSIAAEM